MKRILFFAILVVSLVLTLSGIAEAQILTRFAVVDLNRVYMAYFSESRQVREFMERSARVQAEIDNQTREIQNLRFNMVNLRNQGDMEQAMRLEAEIARREQNLSEYHSVQRSSLESQLNNLRQSSAFLEQIYDEIRLIAESEGYSTVLSLSENAGIIWYSPTVDITDRLIANLRSRAGR